MGVKSSNMGKKSNTSEDMDVRRGREGGTVN